MIDLQLDHGFESGSGFREAFARVFGTAPSQAHDVDCLYARWFETPLGPMLALANDAGLHLLEFVDRRGLERELEALRARLPHPSSRASTPISTRSARSSQPISKDGRCSSRRPLAACGLAFPARGVERIARDPCRARREATATSPSTIGRRHRGARGRPRQRRQQARDHHSLPPCHRRRRHADRIWRRTLAQGVAARARAHAYIRARADPARARGAARHGDGVNAYERRRPRAACVARRALGRLFRFHAGRGGGGWGHCGSRKRGSRLHFWHFSRSRDAPQRTRFSRARGASTPSSALVNTALPFALFCVRPCSMCRVDRGDTQRHQPFFRCDRRGDMAARAHHAEQASGHGGGIQRRRAAGRMAGTSRSMTMRCIAVGACLAASLCYGVASVYAKNAARGTVQLFYRALQPDDRGGDAGASRCRSHRCPLRSPRSSIGNVTALALASTAVAYLLYFRLIADLGPARALTVTFLIPLFGVLWGWLVPR